MNHRELLDALEGRLRSPEFHAMSGGAALTVARPGDTLLTVEAKGADMAVRVEATPLDPAHAPDGRPRVVLKSSRGGSDYADFAIDGLVMGVFGMLLAARQAVH